MSKTKFKRELLRIDQWLNKDGNTKALLAARLGYSSSSVIQQWFRRKSIPVYMRERLMQELSK